MENLAGHKHSTEIAGNELAEAGIPIVELAEPYGEVRATIGGELNGFTFRRAWYYWVVKGPMPLAQAEAMYAHSDGREDVRVTGHCGCPPPHEWLTWMRPDGYEVVEDPEGKQQAELDDLVSRHPDLLDHKHYEFVKDLAVTGAKPFVMSYHVDSAAGLKLLADTIKSLPRSTPGQK